MLRYTFAKHVPLDAPRVDDRGHFLMTDLEVLAGLRSAANVRYRFHVDWHGPDAPQRVSASRTRRPSVWLEPIFTQLRRRYGAEQLAAHPFYTLTWTREANGRPAPDERLTVRMRRLPSGGWLPIGIER
jgi:hypothetical protein